MESVKLGKDLLPEFPVSKHPFSEIVRNEKIGSLELDHCFTGNSSHPYFGIFDRAENEKVILEIHRSFNPSVFFQIYTPPHRQSIAVEPMSSLGNSFSEKNGTHSSIKKNDIKVPEELKIDIVEVTNPDADAHIVAFAVAEESVGDWRRQGLPL
jgi:galactose mutarotase-like enzyme